MYRSVLVPLDGSELAECVLPHLENVLRCSPEAEVVLFSVMDHMSGQVSPREDDTVVPSAVTTTDTGSLVGQGVVVPGIEDDRHRWEETHRYLDRIAGGLRGQGMQVRIDVTTGNPAEQIASLATGGRTDLIVMASHGRSGPSRWAFGSVADKVFRASCVPVLMIRAPGCERGL